MTLVTRSIAEDREKLDQINERIFVGRIGAISVMIGLFVVFSHAGQIDFSGCNRLGLQGLRISIRFALAYAGLKHLPDSLRRLREHNEHWQGT